MLENFRKTQLIWDKASTKIKDYLRGNSSDNNGRKLNVTVTDDGRTVDLTGVSLMLYWETQDKKVNGLDSFTAVHAQTGQFEIYYTPELLSNVGNLNAQLVLVDNMGRVASEIFEIRIFKGIDDGAVVGQASFTALTEALSKVNDLEDNYAPRLNNITAQLTQTDENLDERGINVKRPPVPMLEAKGDGNTDDTTAIQNIINLGQPVFFPNGNYLVDAIIGLKPKSNQEIKLDRVAIIQMKSISNGTYSIFKINNVENVVLTGGIVKGDRNTHTGTTGEWGMGITIGENTSNITLTNITIMDCWGDGVYVGSLLGETENVKLNNIICDNNRRNGLSVVNVDNMVVRDSVFSNTHGTNPQAGIDVEPNAGQTVNNLTLDNCQLYNNAGAGLDIMGVAGTIENIKCNNINSKFNYSGLRLVKCRNIGFSFCDFNENEKYGIEIPRDVRDISFYKTQASKNKLHGLAIVASEQIDGIYNIKFIDCNFDDNSNSNVNMYDGVKIDSIDETGVINNIGFTGCSLGNKEEPKTQRIGLSCSTTSSIITNVLIGIQCTMDNNITGEFSGKAGVVDFYNKKRIQTILADTTAKRPPTALYGTVYFDITLGKPIFKKGSVWVDANGAAV